MSSADQFINQLEALKTKGLEFVSSAQELQELENWKQDFFSKKGALSEVMKSLGTLSPEDRPKVGQVANELRTQLQVKIDEKLELFRKAASSQKLIKESIDVALPGRKTQALGEHPVSIVERELVHILENAGFHCEIGPEVEHEFFNFDALNIPAHHPARAMQDTFYIKGRSDVLLRTQTSPVQIRRLQASAPPIRMCSPGRVYRSDYDATHSPMFHQIEGLAVDKNLSMADLKGVLAYMVTEFFGENVKIRLRPSFFPFTEPSAEIDMSCIFCKGKGCKTCKGSGWIEFGGSGMVDPEVFKAVDLNPEEWRGFAFGMGLERMAMLKYGVNDLRLFFEGDQSFIQQFSRWRL